VAPGNHLLDQNHVEITRATNDDLFAFDERKFATLVLSRNEPKREAGWARPWLGQNAREDFVHAASSSEACTVIKS
jgi:hypothetical protein